MKWLAGVPPKESPPRERDDEKVRIEKRLTDVERRVALLEAEAKVRR